MHSKLQFSEKILDNERIYLYDFQNKLYEELNNFQNIANKSKVSNILMDVEVSCYIFETHPIQEELCGNGNRLIIKSDNIVSMSE